MPTSFQQLLLVVGMAAAVSQAETQFNQMRYQITLNDCRSPQIELGVLIILLGATETSQIIWRHDSKYARFMDIYASQTFDGDGATLTVRPMYLDSCLLVDALPYWCGEIYGIDRFSDADTARK